MKKMKLRLPVILLVVTVCLTALYQGTSQPIGKSPDVEGTVTNISTTTAKEKDAGILEIIIVKGVTVQVTKETNLQIAKVKIVEPGSVADIKNGDRVSVWFKTPADSKQAAPSKADTLIIFRPGQGGAPVPPKSP